MILLLLFDICFSATPANKDYTFSTDLVWRSGMYGAGFYRIPAIAYCRDDSVVAFVDNRYDSNTDLPGDIQVFARKRYPNGTWTDSYSITGELRSGKGDGDVAIVQDRKTGALLAAWAGDRGYTWEGPGTPSNPVRLYISRSYDNGVTWEERKEITDQVYSNECTNCPDDRKNNWQKLFITSGSGLQLRNGTIGFLMLVNDGNERNYALYSHDFGETWNVGTGYTVTGANEAKMVELNNGSIMASIRQYGTRKTAISDDCMNTWKYGRSVPQLVDNGVNGDIKRYTSVIDGYDKNRLLHSIIHSGSGRRNLSLLISYDEGVTWPYSKTIIPTDSCYSAIDISKDGDILIIYENMGVQGVTEDDGSTDNSYDIYVGNFSLEWLTDGADSYTKPQHLTWCLTSRTETDERCQENAYQMSYIVFDNYIESYLVYPENVEYTFTENFRDFTININREGLYKGTYNNLGDQLTVTFAGEVDEAYTKDHEYRELSFTNFVSTLEQKQMFHLGLTLEDSTFTIVNADNVNITLMNGYVQFDAYPHFSTTDHTTVRHGYIRLNSNSHVYIQNVGTIRINSGVNSDRAMKLQKAKQPKASPTIHVSSARSGSTIYFDGDWTESSFNYMELTNLEGTTIFAQSGQIDLFSSKTDAEVLLFVPDSTYGQQISQKVSELAPIIAGSCVGGLVVGFLIGALGVYFYHKRKKKEIKSKTPLNEDIFNL